jgi:hypothetical protein
MIGEADRATVCMGAYQGEALRKKSEALTPPRVGRVVHGDIPGYLPPGVRLAQFGRANWYRRSIARDQTALQLRI